jgi:putative two-component system response regulator
MSSVTGSGDAVAPESSSAAARVEAPRPSVLIVDDTPNNVQPLGDLLAPLYRTRGATHGERALRGATSDDRPDLILLDVMMSGMSGQEVCQRLKADQRTARVPVIFVTAMNEIGDEARGFELGAADDIVKPIGAPIVLAREREDAVDTRAFRPASWPRGI